MTCTTLGINLAKNMFQLHGVDERGQVVVQKRLSRKVRATRDGGNTVLNVAACSHNAAGIRSWGTARVRRQWAKRAASTCKSRSADDVPFVLIRASLSRVDVRPTVLRYCRGCHAGSPCPSGKAA